jgi:calcineurin-like phosphoesterase family protein
MCTWSLTFFTGAHKMNTYITSDLHFGHKNILKFCPATRARFRDDVEYMNEAMVKEWNDIVQPSDLVYILGDVAFLPAQKATQIMQRLNGRKILVEGNHDRKLLQDESFRNCFEEVHKYLDITYNGHKCVMFHYPIAEWDQMHRGSLHFHGHLHGGESGLEKFRARDMGMDATGMIVVPMERAISDALTGEIKGHH